MLRFKLYFTEIRITTIKIYFNFNKKKGLLNINKKNILRA